MFRSASNNGLASRLCVLLLLLCAQSFTLAHEVDHEFADDNSLCAVCSIGHGLQTGVTVSHEPPACEPFSQTPLIECPVCETQIQSVAVSARGPPLSL